MASTRWSVDRLVDPRRYRSRVPPDGMEVLDDRVPSSRAYSPAPGRTITVRNTRAEELRRRHCVDAQGLPGDAALDGRAADIAPGGISAGTIRGGCRRSDRRHGRQSHRPVGRGADEASEGGYTMRDVRSEVGTAVAAKV